MKWNKLGLVYAPDKKFWWNQKYAMMPTPVYMPDTGNIRVYFGTTDKDIFGRTSFIDVDAKQPTKIVNIHEAYILDTGNPGTFDDSGAVPSSVIQVNELQYLYYVGFQRVQKVPYMLFSGLAISTDWKSFNRYSEAPVIDRSETNIYSNAAPFVLFDNEQNIFKMWFWLGREWVRVNNKLYIQAEIRYAFSKNGLQWQLSQEPCIVPDITTEFSVGRPWVVKNNGKYKMFYSVRYVDKLYRMGYAESDDGNTWIRKDHEVGIDVSPTGWDSEMICYPAIVIAEGKTYMFFNGNNNGETGFGVAELINE
jgi:predicted GH43/DUF377 family glycosyl hydrolase